MNKKFGSLSSSANPEQLSARVQGAILAMSGIIIFVAQWLGVPLTEGEIVTFAKEAGIAIGFLWMLFGMIRGVVIRFQQKYNI